MYDPLYDGRAQELKKHLATTSTVEHAKHCSARLVKLFLGSDAIAESKLEHGEALAILGVSVEASSEGFQIGAVSG